MSSDSAPEWPVLSIAEAHARLTAPGQRYEMEEMEIRGVLQRVWKNAPPTLRDIFLNARAFGSREFLVYEDDRATYEAFARAAITLARQLQADGSDEAGKHRVGDVSHPGVQPQEAKYEKKDACCCGRDQQGRHDGCCGVGRHRRSAPASRF
jgi:hypothetical protein